MSLSIEIPNNEGPSPRASGASGRGSPRRRTRKSPRDDHYDPKLHSPGWKRLFSRMVVITHTRRGRRMGLYAICGILGLLAMLYSASGTGARIGRTAQRRVRAHVWPRTLCHYFNEDGRVSNNDVLPVDPRRTVRAAGEKSVHLMSEYLESQLSTQKRRKLSERYKKYKQEALKPSCDYQYEWQKTSFPTCNVVHETNWADRDDNTDGLRNSVYINNGGWVDIWMVPEYDGTKRVLKAKRYKHDFTDRNFDRYRRDALSMERLTSAPNILDIYGFCGVTALVDYADGGDIENYMEAIKESSSEDDEAANETRRDKLIIASQVLTAIAVVHNFDKEGRASIAHTDISPYQFIRMKDGKFVLNDFNRARFIGWNNAWDKPCGFEVGNNPGKWRSPEEYRYDEESEKIDVYSAGNVLFYLLTGQKPWDAFKLDEVKKMVIDGDRPHIPRNFRQSENPIDIALIKAMKMCWTHDPDDRSSAIEVASFLVEELQKYTSQEDTSVKEIPGSREA